MPDRADSREEPRVAVEAFVRIDSEDGKEYVFQTRDLSLAGLFLYSRISHSYPFKVGSRLKLELIEHDRQVDCTVVVARIVEPGSEEANEYPTGFGVRIIEIEDDARRLLSEMVERVKAA